MVTPLATNVETTLAPTTMTSTRTSTAMIFNGIGSTIMHSSSATASGPNNREEGKIISYA